MWDGSKKECQCVIDRSKACDLKLCVPCLVAPVLLFMHYSFDICVFGRHISLFRHLQHLGKTDLLHNNQSTERIRGPVPNGRRP